MLKLIKPYITFQEVETEFQNIFQSSINKTVLDQVKL